MSESAERSRLEGILVIGLAAVGVIGLLGALEAFNEQQSAGAGICLIATALSWGLLLHALVRR
jgi:hypothetical protein